MKRKNITVKSTNISEEGTSDDEEANTDQNSEMEADEECVNDDEVEGNNLDDSATDSDENESDINSDVEDSPELTNAKKSKIERIKESITQRYLKRHGKQLYIRFPHKIPDTQEALEEKVRELTPLVVKVRKPRQRYSRFCLVDFDTKEDRDTALNDLKKSIKKGDLNKYVVNTPRTESADFVQKLVERKIKSIENNKVKLRLKKATKKSLQENNYTSTVIVLNLPSNTSILQTRELFPNAVDVNIRPSKGKFKDKSIAAITFPTTFEARNAARKKLFLGGNELSIKFDNKRFKKDANKDSKTIPENCAPNQKGKISNIFHKKKLDTKLKKVASQNSNTISKNCESSQGANPVIKKQNLELTTQNVKGNKSNKNKRVKKDESKDRTEVSENSKSNEETKPFIKEQNVTEKKSNSFVYKQNINKNKVKKNKDKIKLK